MSSEEVGLRPSWSKIRQDTRRVQLVREGGGGDTRWALGGSVKLRGGHDKSVARGSSPLLTDCAILSPFLTDCAILSPFLGFREGVYGRDIGRGNTTMRSLPVPDGAAPLRYPPCRRASTAT